MTLAEMSGDLIRLVNDLRAVGADVDLDLPGIIFTGKQSSAKSSLVQASTGVTLPRKDGTCTRCAIEVTTRSALEWSAEVSIRLTYDERAGLEVSTPFPQPKVERMDKLDASKKDKLADSIVRAQTLLLNPKAYIEGIKEEFLFKRSSESFELKFTRNCVCVLIEGSQSGDLSITDLPGLIQSTDNKDDEKYIDLVTDLTLQQMKKPHTVIVTCLATNDDVENQAIRKHARECDPNGLRTLGVLTKPDLIEANTQHKWMEVMAGNRYQTSLGYFVVRTPTQSELDRGQDDVAAVGDKFFNEHVIGKEFLELVPNRCGADQLRRQLSKMLKERIAAQLPSIQKELRNQLQCSQAMLESLGPLVTEESAKSFTVQILDDFENGIRASVLAHEQPAEWIRRFRKLGRKFCRDLDSSAPVFKVCSIVTLSNALRQAIACGDQEDLIFTTNEFERLQHQFDDPNLQGKANKEATIAFYSQALAKLQELPYDRCKTRTPINSISSTLETIDANRGRELPFPGAASYKAFVAIASQHIKLWNEPSLQFVRESSQLLEDLAMDVVQGTMGNQLKLNARVKVIVAAEIQSLTDACLQEVRRMHSQQEQPSEAFSTFNSDYLHQLMSRKATELHASKDEGIVDIGFLQQHERDQLQQLLQKMGTSMQRLRFHHDPTADTAIDTMAMAYSYCKLAQERYSDQVPKEIDDRILRSFAGAIRTTLVKKLNLLEGSSKDVFELVAPDEALLRKKEDIAAKIKRQKRALKLIDDFMQACGSQ